MTTHSNLVHGEAGTLSLGSALVVVAVLALIGVFVHQGAAIMAVDEVSGAAFGAARAAARQTSAETATAAADHRARRALLGGACRPGSTVVLVDTRRFEPDVSSDGRPRPGHVFVRVSCVTSAEGKAVSASGFAPVSPYRDRP